MKKFVFGSYGKIDLNKKYKHPGLGTLTNKTLTDDVAAYLLLKEHALFGTRIIAVDYTDELQSEGVPKPTDRIEELDLPQSYIDTAHENIEVLNVCGKDKNYAIKVTHAAIRFLNGEGFDMKCTTIQEEEEKQDPAGEGDTGSVDGENEETSSGDGEDGSGKEEGDDAGSGDQGDGKDEDPEEEALTLEAINAMTDEEFNQLTKTITDEEFNALSVEIQTAITVRLKSL